jgi:hypothetical protein
LNAAPSGYSNSGIAIAVSPLAGRSISRDGTLGENHANDASLETVEAVKGNIEMKAIRIGVGAFVFALFSIVLCAQATDKDALATPGCGDFNAKFDVKTEGGLHTIQPQSGKATVYMIENDSDFSSIPKPTTRMGVDGKWMGATHGNSYLYFFVDPGVHHLCASWQRTVVAGRGHQTEAAHFTAQAGGAYYFEVKSLFFSDQPGQVDVSLTPLDSDEGQLLVNLYRLSTSLEKK